MFRIIKSHAGGFNSFSNSLQSHIETGIRLASPEDAWPAPAKADIPRARVTRAMTKSLSLVPRINPADVALVDTNAFALRVSAFSS